MGSSTKQTNRVAKPSTNGPAKHDHPTRPEPAADKSSPAAKTAPAKSAADAPAAGLWKFPPEKRETHELKALTFDKRLQHRGSTTDPETVESYAEIAKERKKDNPEIVNGGFPPLKAVSDGKTVWVYNGFQRGAAFEKAGIKSVEIDVVPGTFEDALFLSLSANGDNALQRSKADKRRSVCALLDNPTALKKVLDTAEGNGGVHRVMAAACAVSRALVENVLTDRGLQARGNKLTKKSAKPESPAQIPGTVDAEQEPAGGPGEATAPGTVTADPAAQKAANDKAWADMMARQYTQRMEDATRLARKFATSVASLLGDATHGATVARVMAEHGYPVDPKMTQTFLPGSEESPYIAIMEYWPLAQKLGEMFLDMRRTCEGAKNPAPWENPTPVAQSKTLDVPGTTEKPADGAATTTMIDASPTAEVAGKTGSADPSVVATKTGNSKRPKPAAEPKPEAKPEPQTAGEAPQG